MRKIYSDNLIKISKIDKLLIISDLDNNYQKIYPIEDFSNQQDFIDFTLIDYFLTFTHYHKYF